MSTRLTSTQRRKNSWMKSLQLLSIECSQSCGSRPVSRKNGSKAVVRATIFEAENSWRADCATRSGTPQKCESVHRPCILRLRRRNATSRPFMETRTFEYSVRPEPTQTGNPAGDAVIETGATAVCTPRNRAHDLSISPRLQCASHGRPAVRCEPVRISLCRCAKYLKSLQKCS